MAKMTLAMLISNDYKTAMSEATSYESDGALDADSTCSATHGGTITGLTGGDRLVVAPPAWIAAACAANVSAMPLVAWLLYRFYAVQQNETAANSPTRITRSFKMLGDSSEVWYTVKIKVDDFGDFPARLGSPIDDLT